MKSFFILLLLFSFHGCSAEHISVPIDTKKPKFIPNKALYPFKSNYITLKSGAKIHYVDEGKGDVLLLLHGNPTWSFLYRNIIGELSKHFRVIAPDYAGFGLSYASKEFDYSAKNHAKVMREFVNEMHLENMTIMVQDWGGPIGFDIALHYPKRVKAFVIGNTWAWPLERVGHKAFSTLFGSSIGEFLAWSSNGIVSFFMSQGVVDKLNDDALAMYHEPFKDKSTRTPTHIFPAQLWDASVFLGRVYRGLPTLKHKPVLIVWGLEDFAFQKPERERFEAIFVNYKTVLLENTGHFIQEDAPEKIVDAIKRWYPTLKNN